MRSAATIAFKHTGDEHEGEKIWWKICEKSIIFAEGKPPEQQDAEKADKVSGISEGKTEIRGEN